MKNMLIIAQESVVNETKEIYCLIIGMPDECDLVELSMIEALEGRRLGVIAGGHIVSHHSCDLPFDRFCSPVVNAPASIEELSQELLAGLGKEINIQKMILNEEIYSLSKKKKTYWKNKGPLKQFFNSHNRQINKLLRIKR